VRTDGIGIGFEIFRRGKIVHLSAVIITRDRRDVLEECLQRIDRANVFSELVVVDDASCDGTEAMVSDFTMRNIFVSTAMLARVRQETKGCR
jgi:hypothetical protein